MASATRVGEGNMIDHAHSSAVSAGDILKVGTLILVASRPAAANELIGWHTTGLIYGPKATGGSTAITKGTKVYWDNTNSVFTATSSSNTLAGHAAATSLDADATQLIRLNQLG